jgi:hypothetical protein
MNFIKQILYEGDKLVSLNFQLQALKVILNNNYISHANTSYAKLAY